MKVSTTTTELFSLKIMKSPFFYEQSPITINRKIGNLQKWKGSLHVHVQNVHVSININSSFIDIAARVLVPEQKINSFLCELRSTIHETQKRKRGNLQKIKREIHQRKKQFISFSKTCGSIFELLYKV